MSGGPGRPDEGDETRGIALAGNSDGNVGFKEDER